MQGMTSHTDGRRTAEQSGDGGGQAASAREAELLLALASNLRTQSAPTYLRDGSAAARTGSGGAGAARRSARATPRQSYHRIATGPSDADMGLAPPPPPPSTAAHAVERQRAAAVATTGAAVAVAGGRPSAHRRRRRTNGVQAAATAGGGVAAVDGEEAAVLGGGVAEVPTGRGGARATARQRAMLARRRRRAGGRAAGGGGGGANGSGENGENGGDGGQEGVGRSGGGEGGEGSAPAARDSDSEPDGKRRRSGPGEPFIAACQNKKRWRVPRAARVFFRLRMYDPVVELRVLTLCKALAEQMGVSEWEALEMIESAKEGVVSAVVLALGAAGELPLPLSTAQRASLDRRVARTSARVLRFLQLHVGDKLKAALLAKLRAAVTPADVSAVDAGSSSEEDAAAAAAAPAPRSSGAAAKGAASSEGESLRPAAGTPAAADRTADHALEKAAPRRRPAPTSKPMEDTAGASTPAASAGAATAASVAARSGDGTATARAGVPSPSKLLAECEAMVRALKTAGAVREPGVGLRAVGEAHAALLRACAAVGVSEHGRE